MSYDNRRGSKSARKRRKKRRIRFTLDSLTRIGLLILGVLIIVLGIVLLTKCGSDKEDKKTTTTTEATTTTPSGEIEPSSGDGDEESTTPNEDETPVDPASVYGDNITNDGKIIVCVDAGHGGEDGGCVGDNDRLEKDDSLRLAKAVQSALENLGVEVIMTRTGDTNPSKFERPAMANEAKADVFISIHRNSYQAEASVQGVEAWISSQNPTNSYNLSTAIMSALDEAGISRNRGVRTGTPDNASEDYAINSQSLMPSLILEMGFITNTTDNNLYDTKQQEYANAIAKAIFDWVSNQ